MEKKSQNEKSAHQLVADEILGVNFTPFTVGKKTLFVYPPNIKTFSRMVGLSGTIEYKDEADAIRQIAENSHNVAKYVAFAVLGERYERWYGKILYNRIYKQILRATAKELKNAIEAANSMLGLDFFFQASSLLMGAKAIAVREET